MPAGVERSASSTSWTWWSYADLMGRLVYGALCSLDGYTEDPDGRFDWATPDEEVHAFVNELERPVGTYLYGRRMYETMAAWETMPTGPDESPAVTDYATLWRRATKVVYSTSLREAPTAHTRIERVFDADAVARLKRQSVADLSIGGPTLAAGAFAAGLIDELYLIVQPVSVGGGKPALPPGLRLRLNLLDELRFGCGAVYLRYAVGR